MPTNLPPEYFQIDKRYRAAESTEEKIALLEELLGTIPKHKGTEKLRGEYKGRLAKLRDEAHAHTKAGRKGSAFQVEREGAGQVVLVGCANSGKSSLLRALTHAEPKFRQPRSHLGTYAGNDTRGGRPRATGRHAAARCTVRRP
jgi:ABC-type transport system involved in cytochrome bd biosynthesis fused ATPase/permease subunit